MAASDKATCAVVGVDTGAGVQTDTAALLAARLSAAAMEQPSFAMLPHATAAARLEAKGFDREVYDYPRTAYVMAGRMLDLHYVIYGKAKIEGSSCILSTALARVWDGEVVTTKTTVLQGDLAKVLAVIPEQNMLALLHSLHDLGAGGKQDERAKPIQPPWPQRIGDGANESETGLAGTKIKVEKSEPASATTEEDLTRGPAPRPPESIATQPATEPLQTILDPPDRAPRVAADADPKKIDVSPGRRLADPTKESRDETGESKVDLRPSAEIATEESKSVATPGTGSMAGRPTRSDFRAPRRSGLEPASPPDHESGAESSIRSTIAGRLEVGVRVSQFSLLEDSSGALDAFGVPQGTFIGTINGLEEEQELIPPEVFVHFNLNQYIGIELAYDSLELKTRTVDDKSDGTLTMSGPVFSLIGRYPTGGSFTPYAGLGVALFGAEFDAQAHWALGFTNPEEFAAAGSPSTPNGGRTRTMFVDDGTGVVLTGGCLWRFADDWAADAFVRYMDIDSSALFRVQVSGRTTTEGTGTFIGENLAFGIGVRYAPQ
jgi:hypothetical protein